MPGTVLYRKWRPKQFADIVGQDVIVRTLKNAVLQKKIAHAYLFTGPRGTGKTSMGRIFAKAVNVAVDKTGEPISGNQDAREFDEGSALDFIEIDAASNRGIENIRDLRDRANYVPNSTAFKVYLIDEVHQLTDAAADALLKTLEEPPPHVVFILATTDPGSLKATILSRCQRFDFRRIASAEIVRRLQVIAKEEGIAIPEEGLLLIARESTGSMRDAINLLDHVWATFGDDVSLEDTIDALGLSTDVRAAQLARAALTKNLTEAFQIIGAVQDDAIDLVRFNRQVIQHLRNGLLHQTNAINNEDFSELEIGVIQELVTDIKIDSIVMALRVFALIDMRGDPFSALPLELAMTQLVYDLSVSTASKPTQNARKIDGQSPKRRSQSRELSGKKRDSRKNRNADSQFAKNTTQRERIGNLPSPTEGTSDEKKITIDKKLSSEEQLLVNIQAELRSQGQHKLAAYLKGSCRISIEDDIVTFAFLPFAIDFHKTKVEEQVKVIDVVLEKIRGRSSTIICTTADEETGSSNSLVAEAERLGAKVVSRREG